METLLELKNINHSFDGLLAVDNFSVSILQETVTGLIGPNGAGKTTVFNIISGFLNLKTGEILYKKKDITRLPPSKIAQSGIARTFQDLRLINRLTVLDNVLLSRPHQMGEAVLTAVLRPKRILAEEKNNRKKAIEILEFVRLADKQNELASALSYGQQKLLSLACCLATEAELFLLDEPVSGVNPDIIEKIVELMRKLIGLGTTILFIEHNIESVRQVSDHIIVMDHGQNIAEGPPIKILENQAILEAYLE